MREFFRGWRRKAGCVTLVMASAFLAAAFRGSKSVAIIGEPVEKRASRSQVVIEVSCAGLMWEKYQFPFRSGDYGQGFDSLSDVQFYRSISQGRKCKWQQCFLGLEIGEYGTAPDLWFRRTYVIIPSDFVALVLSLTSASLLLSKPRPAKPPQFPLRVGSSHE